MRNAYSSGDWSCPTIGLASVLMLRPISPELVLSPGLLSFEHPSVLLFLLCTPPPEKKKEICCVYRVVCHMYHLLRLVCIACKH